MIERIYTVTTVHSKDKKDGLLSRTVAWYPELAEAMSCIINNYGDIHEITYKYALIEVLEPGLYPKICDEYWYEWIGDNETGGYQRCLKPAEYKQIVSFSIG